MEIKYGKISASVIFDEMDAYLANKFETCRNLKEIEKVTLQSLREFVFAKTLKCAKLGFFKQLNKCLNDTIHVIYKNRQLNVYSKIVVLSTNGREDENRVENVLGYPLSKLVSHSDFSIHNIMQGFYSIYLTFKLLRIINDIPYYSKENFYFLYSHILNYYSILLRLKFKNIEKIITANTAYGPISAVVKKANCNNIKVVKIEYYLNNAYPAKIYADCYYPLDKVHREFYQSFECNKGVKFLGNGGRLSCDFLAKYLDIPKVTNDVKDIIYLTSHSIYDNVDNFYIEQLMNFVKNHNGYRLTIKIHPHSNKNYSEQSIQGAIISRATGDEYFKMARQADFIFSIYSTLVFQSKFINENCYNLGFCEYPEINAYRLPKTQQVYAKYIEVVDSFEMLKDILLGNHKTTSIEYYTQELNPDFPNCAEKFKELVNKL